MVAIQNELRRTPLRIAGVIGMASALIYLGGVAGQDDTSQVPVAVAFAIVMIIAGVMAWVADRSGSRGRRVAMGSAGIFFVLGLLSGSVFSWIFLLGTVLCVAGFAGTVEEGTEV